MPADSVFRAPWSITLTLITMLTSLLLLGILAIGLLTGPRNSLPWFLGMVFLPLLILIATACFSVRGYALDGQTLYIQRLGWTSKVGLQTLVTAKADPKAMEGSLRTWGNGGLFSFTGNFRNQQLGAYQAYATDPKRSVVLKFAQRTLVLTPDRPARFVQSVLAHRDS